METLKKRTIYWTLFSFEKWPLVLAATTEGLCYVGSLEQFQAWSTKPSLKNSQIEQNDQLMQPYSEQFSEYLQGDRQQFTIPTDYFGTDFQKSIWDALLEIPFGETCAYSDIAERVHKPQAVRAVGTAIGANPILIVVPCHRVIGKNKALTGFRSGLEMKAMLLQFEGAVYSTAESNS